MHNASKDQSDIKEVCINAGVGKKIQDRINRHWKMKKHPGLSAREFAIKEIKVSREARPEIVIEKETIVIEKATAEAIVIEKPVADDDMAKVEEVEPVEEEPEESDDEEESTEEEKEDSWPEV